MKPLRLRTSLTLAYVGILALVITAMGVAFHFALVRRLDTAATDSLSDKARALHGFLRFADGRPSLAYDASDPEETAFIHDATRYYQVYDANTGGLLTQSAGLEALGLRYTPGEVAELKGQSEPHDVATDAGRLRLATSVLSPRPGEAYLVQVGELLTSTDGALAGFDRILWIRILFGVAVAALLGPWFARRALAPLAQLAATTRTIGIGNLRDRVTDRGTGDELDQVARAFNQTLARLEESVGDMRQFSAALAHELRTPIAILRGEAEFELAHPLSGDERRERLMSQIEEYDRLTRLISRILTLARAESGEIKLGSEPVALGALAAAVSEQIEPVASARDIGLTCDPGKDVWVLGDPGWLERLLLILLDNAIKFTPDGGHVAIQVSRRDDGAQLRVVDSGAGIAPEAIPHLFKRFYRSQSAVARHTPGFGLGLALAKWIAEQHGAAIGVMSPPGAGTTITVSFRALPPSVAAREEARADQADS